MRAGILFAALCTMMILPYPAEDGEAALKACRLFQSLIEHPLRQDLRVDLVARSVICP